MRLLITLIALLIVTPSAVAQNISFDAFIDREDIRAGEIFQIKLELIDAEATGNPNLRVFPWGLDVLNQQKFQDYALINGRQSLISSWVVDLKSPSAGTFDIPAIKIPTNAGILYTKPFRVIIKGEDKTTSAAIGNTVLIELKTETEEVFADEPFPIKVTIHHKGDLQQAELIKPKSNGAIIEQIEDPKQNISILNGQEFNQIEVEYIVTPMNPGSLEIEPASFQGQAPIQNQSSF